jgi:hypothetical protein
MFMNMLKIFVTALFVVGVSFGFAQAGDNDGGSASAPSSAEGLIDIPFFGVDAFGVNTAVTLKCKGAKPICVQVADCCISGDIFRASISKGSGKQLDHTSNTGLGPDVFSAPACSNGNLITVTTGNNLPGGVPAGMTVRVTNPGGFPLTCSIVDRVN